MAEFLFLNPTIVSSQSIANDKPSRIVQLRPYKKVIPFINPNELNQTKPNQTISKESSLKTSIQLIK